MSPVPTPVQTRDLTKHYGETVGLDGLDLVVEQGEVLGLLGPNGAGKTTTIRLVLDLIRPTRGEVLLFGLPVGDPAARARVGYLPGELSLDERLSGRGMLDLMDGLRAPGTPPADSRRRAELCERLGLTAADLARRLRDDSRGTKQKIGLIAAWQHDPDLLILDEPTTGLDPLVREAIFELMHEACAAGRTIFHSSHVLSEVDRTCTRVVVLRDGRLVTSRSIDDLRAGLARTMAVRFRDDAPIEALVAAGTELIEHDGARVVLRITGELDALLGVLALHPVEHLAFPEPDLEDAFAEIYGAPSA